MNDGLSAAAAVRAPTGIDVDSFTAALETSFPTFRRTLAAYADVMRGYGADARADLDDIFAVLGRLAQQRAMSTTDLLDAFADFMVDYLREQSQFLDTGAYSNQGRSFDDVRREVYDDDSYMNFYLLGLLISYGVFPHHYREYRFFSRRFLPSLQRELPCAEFGVGHGLFLSSVLEAGRASFGVGYDVSPAALSLAGDMMRVKGVPPGRYTLVHGDAVSEEMPHGQYGGMIAAGLLEHIERPQEFLERLRGKLAPRDGRFFSMVPVDTAHADHLVLFENLDDIRRLFSDSGFALVEEEIVDTGDFSATPADKRQEGRHPIYHLGLYRVA
jgi:2-polyprenyl-3-methyl-5-hydroxy-6-metoxy-1,4-benzoquinol methylase